MHRFALLALAGLTLASCTGDAGADAPEAIVFAPDTPRQTILDAFEEVLAWTDVEISNQIVLGQNRCVVTVTVSDTTRAEALRAAFLPIAEAEATNLCPPVVAVRFVPFTRAQVVREALAGARAEASSP